MKPLMRQRRAVPFQASWEEILYTPRPIDSHKFDKTVSDEAKREPAELKCDFDPISWNSRGEFEGVGGRDKFLSNYHNDPIPEDVSVTQKHLWLYARSSKDRR